jgi:hypothetical protein
MGRGVLVKKIIVDFNNKIIDSNNKIWIAFPGEAYRLISDFLNASIVYPDILHLPDDDSVYDDTKLLARVMTRSERIREWHRPNTKMVERPSGNLADYANARWNKSRDNARSIVKGILQRADKGDLVVTPGPGGYLGVSHVGEFVDIPSNRRNHKTPLYEGEIFLGRPVRWLAQFRNDQIPAELLQRLTLPVGFSQLERSFYRAVYSRAYKSFTYNGEFASVISTDSKRYTSVPAMHIDLISNYAAGIIAAIEKSPEEVRNFFKKGFLEAAHEKAEDEYVSDLNISVASPGKIRQFASKLTPILTNALLRLGTFGADSLKESELDFINSANGGPLDDNDLEVRKGLESAVSLMDLESLKKICKSAEVANSKADLTNSVTAQLAAE